MAPLPVSSPRVPSTIYEMRERVIQLLDEAAATLARDQEAARNSLAEARLLLAQAPLATAPEPALHGGLVGWQIRRVIAFVDTHLDATIHVKEMAAEARLSLSHFSHAFKLTFGEPPLAYVTRRRLARACEMMLAGNAPLSRIAHDCGFYDQSHFTRHFHRRLGMTPQRWRRLHAEGPGD
ncbi:helix-turn-helix transcriptional regulator [Halomonas sp. MCCC 1A17488]|uniref:helix-turn-helix transcriptional regulator n=1 Tax=unclassified Halomonas TaxID=2609666 RepID=UPI0018D211E8|nr:MULTISPECIES: AraC family transcriptional regulator [unclassified Halomonas]MCE8017693.1 helix-turn-helix transcriptional regulator [Halomonas sp. MCCC 1A17488]MCG3241026.1 helix-turn-helix transcriptional regulator [Halomonas sp. MCCC 1A17488]QPP48891.1 helix-turn-helix transcriptional regulator [Halomonas sp. SS10-MC5]